MNIMRSPIAQYCAGMFWLAILLVVIVGGVHFWAAAFEVAR